MRRSRRVAASVYTAAALLSIGLAGWPASGGLAADSSLIHGIVSPPEPQAPRAAAGSPAPATPAAPGAASAPATAAARASAVPADVANAQGFAFYPGTWHVKNKKLKVRLKGSQEWITSEATDVVRPVLDGVGVVAEYNEPSAGAGYKGMSFYLFDPAARQWSLFWADGRSGRMDPPLKGAFTNGRGEFFGDDQHEGQPIKVRFIWRSTSPTTAHWEQAFSTDQGKTWETNWLMELTRVK